MTDEQMDARLRRAGEAWRAADAPNAAIEPADPVDLHTVPRRHYLRRPGLLISAAAIVAALAAGLVVVFGVGGGTSHRAASQTAELERTVWQLVTYGSDRPQADTTLSLVFNHDGTFVADDSCLVFGGPVDATGGQLFFTPRHSRPRPCTVASAAGRGPLDQRVEDAFISFPGYTLRGNDLTIDSSPAMHFRSMPELAPPSLDVPSIEDATWQLIAVRDGKGTDVPVPASGLTFRLDGQELTASDGCNTLTGSVDIEGGRLSIAKGGGFASTQVACPTAQVVDDVLNGNPTWMVDGATLTLHGTGGTLTYQWVPDDKAATDPATVIGRTWRLTAADGHSSVGAADADWLRIDASGVVSGHDCKGTLAGTAQLRAGTLHVNLADTSYVGCIPSVDGITQQSALWTIRDGKLVIFNAGASQADSLVFTPDQPVPPPPAPSIDGGTWTLAQISTETTGSGSGSGSGTAGDFGISLQLTTTTYRLQTRCNAYVGHASRQGDTIAFAQTLDQGGPPCKYSGVATVLHTLDGTVHWKLDSGELELTGDGTTLTFDR